VLDALLDEALAVGPEAAARIERFGRRLGVEAHERGPGRPRLALGRLEQGRADPVPAACGLYRHPAEACHHSVEQQAAGAHDPAPLQRDQVKGLAITPVAIGRAGDALLTAKDALAQAERDVDLVGRA
jgi:hypothetical protein